MIRSASCVLILLVAGCSTATPPAEQPLAPAKTQSTPPPPPVVETTEDPSPDVLGLSEDIRSACKIDAPQTYFAYNSASVEQRASDVLAQVAECFTTGPLRGKTLALVGHTDPRGDDEYNYALGGRRAAKVEQKLGQLGVPQQQLTTTSRGENEAQGTDEASWRTDRRVDLQLGS